MNILDWTSAYGFALSAELLAAIDIPVLVAWGGASHRAMRRLNALLGAHIPDARLAEIDGAAHFMIATHANQVASLIARRVAEVEAGNEPGESLPIATSCP